MPEKKKLKTPTKPEFHKKKIEKVNNKKFLLLFPVLLVIILVCVFLFSFRKSSSPGNFFEGLKNSTSTETVIECPQKSLFDGRCVGENESVQPAIVGVMIENYLEAQPLAGVSKASIVYEAPVEGNIPRFLALYAVGDAVPEVGPVRSARPYYLDWLSEYGDAMYMHVGGSNEALEKIKTYNIFDINEFYNGARFWRAKDRYAPHNTFTSSERWQKAYADLSQKRNQTTYTGWNFDGQTECTVSTSTACVQKISFSYVPGVYEVEWKYNAEKKVYERYQNGTLHKDKDGQIMVAHTILVQHADMDILDEVGRRKIMTIGEDKVEVYSLGNKIFGTWKKETRQSRTEWFDESGESIPLSSGKIWVEVVPTGIVVSNE